MSISVFMHANEQTVDGNGGGVVCVCVGSGGGGRNLVGREDNTEADGVSVCSLH